MDCSLVKPGSFRVLRHKVDRIVCPDVTFIQEYACASGY